MVLRLGSSPEPRVTVELLRRARAAGVTLFDTEAGAASARAERWIGTVFPEPEKDVVVATAAPANFSEMSEPLGHRALDAVRHRLGGRSPDLIYFDGATVRDPAKLRAAADLARRCEMEGWGIRLPAGPEAPELAQRALDTGASAVKLGYNLLEPSPGESILAACERAGAAGLVTNVHATGLLDGSLFRSSPADRPAPPVSFREMESRYAPVLALGFLTVDGRRTLAQAAIQFAAVTPGVASVLISPDSAPVLEEFLGSMGAPPLTEAERGRITARSGDARPELPSIPGPG